jgi:benzoylformate decarboxylase
MAPSGQSDASDGGTNLVPLRVAVLDQLRALEMTTVFGNPGSTELGFLHSWPADVDYVLGLQESSVVAMADGFTRANGRAAVLNLHSAAGIGHGLGAIYTSFKNQAPVVIICGQQSRALLPGNPFLGASDAASFPKPYVKFSLEPARAEDVLPAIAHAHAIASARPCGPTFVSVPADDWNVLVKPWKPRKVSRESAPDPDMIRDLAAALHAASNPVLVIGPEVDSEACGETAVALAEKLRVPVWASPFAPRVCFPEDHGLFAGHLPAAPGAISASLIKHDLIVVLGAPTFTFHVPGQCDVLTSEIPIYQLTTCAETAAAGYAGVSIIGSLKLGLQQLLSLTTESQRPIPSNIRPPFPTPQAANPIPASYLFHMISQALPTDSILFEETPSHRPLVQRYMPIKTWNGFHTMASGGLGYGLPAAVGFALSGTPRKVVLVIGDGSFMYSCQALWTACQRKLPLTVFIVNNSEYAAVKSIGAAMGVSNVPGVDLPGLNFVSIAKGMGCEGTKVEKHEDLGEAIKTALASATPVVVDVCVSNELTMLYTKA